MHNVITLRHNSGMLRDCWWEKDPKDNQPILVIRQVKFIEDNAQQPITKLIRLTNNEFVKLGELISKGPDIIS